MSTNSNSLQIYNINASSNFTNSESQIFPTSSIDKQINCANILYINKLLLNICNSYYSYEIN